jgi:hypothetical protein
MTDLIDTLDTASEFDAIGKLQPGEPYFMLIGRDRLAPPLIQKWADDNRSRALKEYSDGIINKEKRDRELRKSRDAEARGWALAAFKAGDLAKKVVGEPTVKTYTGAEVPEETKRRDALQSARIRTAEALNAAIGLMMLLDELLDDRDDQESIMSAAILHTLDNMRAASSAIEIKRRPGGSQ